MTRLLILGGTAEAAALARGLQAWPDLDVTTSLAGRTRMPEALSGEIRIGGFGGVEGLEAYLSNESFDLLIDATHPFAEQMSHNAALAAERAGVRRLRLVRPSWQRRSGDNWIEVADIASASEVLPSLAGRVFLTSGHQDLAAFAKLDNIWFLIRTIEPVAGPLPRQGLALQARGPFIEEDEVALLQEHRIEALVTKASGGDATYAKIVAARRLGLPVVMIRRPPEPSGPIVHDVDAALVWLRQVTG